MPVAIQTSEGESYGQGCASLGRGSASVHCREKRTLARCRDGHENQQGTGHRNGAAQLDERDNPAPCAKHQDDHVRQARHAAKMPCDPNDTDGLVLAAAYCQLEETPAADNNREMRACIANVGLGTEIPLNIHVWTAGWTDAQFGIANS